ncbi:hypothetical protein B0A49_04135 [Cryomyces minteri]|uniref:Uncharacterized protein n=1 Tax=Cryomyces minteri TaxID=331657 RepID=A0A4U0XMC3_9PEZI|nr:hypothetical protein B0A49_04135 [Cryomyces minteri]
MKLALLFAALAGNLAAAAVLSICCQETGTISVPLASTFLATPTTLATIRLRDAVPQLNALDVLNAALASLCTEGYCPTTAYAPESSAHSVAPALSTLPPTPQTLPALFSAAPTATFPTGAWCSCIKGICQECWTGPVEGSDQWDTTCVPQASCACQKYEGADPANCHPKNYWGVNSW